MRRHAYMARVAPLMFLPLLLLAVAGHAETYQEPEAFVAESFGGTTPEAKLLYLNGATAEGYRSIMGEPPRRLRQRYWSEGAKEVWILEAIGKEQPITAGFVLEKGAITLARVLEFRESRGWEIHYPFFTRQFNGARLDQQQKLDRNIDGISGATLSVSAMVHMSRLALYLSQRSHESSP